MKKYTIGVDVGGTNVKLGLINPAGKIVARSHLPTKQFTRSKSKLIQAIIDAIVALYEEHSLKKKDILGIGIGLPGLINPVEGIVKFLPNIPGWRNVALKSLLYKKLRIPTFIENDVNLITLAEWKFGAGKKSENMVCITLGTGVGGGLILNNALYRGEGFVAGEIGHIPINEKGPLCSCGGRGCFERYVGNKYLQERAGKIFKNKNIRLEDVFGLANQGNLRAIEFWEEMASHIGYALIGVINVLNPRLVVIGGGVSNNFKYLGKTINRVIDKQAMNVQAKMVKVVRAKLGDDAGIIGAHVLVKDHHVGQKK